VCLGAVEQLDSSQMLALASIWSVLLGGGLVAAAFPSACAITKACQTAVQGHIHSHEVTFMTETVTAMNGALSMGLGLILGIPIAAAAGNISLDGVYITSKIFVLLIVFF
jgi:hypothetical protein